MKFDLDGALLKNGEVVRISKVRHADSVWGPRIKALLAHKPEKYIAHINAAFDNKVSNDTNFYIALSDTDDIYGIAMTVQTGDGRGHLAHVFTVEDHRRRGVSSAIIDALQHDFKSHGGRVLFLGTEYNSGAYWLYHRMGFRDLPDQPEGTMYWTPEFDYITESEILQ